MKLSVSMIVRDEESCLEKCLRSVIGADELVVVDTGSKDRTKEIASMFAARVFDFPWVDDFAKARNYSLQQCTGDWIMVVDADEELEIGGIEKTRKAVASAGSNLTIGVRCKSKRGGQVHMSPRVFRRCPEVFWKGAIHNCLSVVETNPGDIEIEYGYSEAHAKDPDRALRMLTNAMLENQSAVREAYYLAREYWYRKDYAAAARWYADYLTRATWAPEIADAWLMTARCMLAMGNGELARDACMRAIMINADFEEALRFMAELSGPKNRARWLAFAATAQNDSVLFVRPGPAPGLKP